MLVNMNDLLQKAQKEKYAVAAFDCVEDVFVRAILDAAAEINSPVILMALEHDLRGRGMDYIAGIIKTAAAAYDIPIALHLDHATNFTIIDRALKNGFTSVMYDGSSLPFEKNIENTRRVVQMAESYGAAVEAELGHVAGKELSGTEDSHSIQLTDPNEVKTFVDRTNINALAVSIGTAHGIYVSEPKLNITRLREITSASKIPLVLHGGSGTPETELTSAVHNGITKINVYSDLRVAFGRSIKAAADAAGRIDPLPDTIFTPARQSIGRIVKDRIHLFGSAGRAN